ncbi:periplasmic heavy metal sensor [Brevundimonas sp. UBA2416]|uniref:periplasmic heavy metal sensor n=1 Tax=Brevundimonas sp. UBA2416 TaxID=1946124 RepID=UPI0025B89EAC|nr:periplasmic heavy metal sensor [Brevundimonas sp. UBA2416]
MSPKALKLALIGSVALNLFGVAAGATLLVTRAQVEDRVEAQHRPARAGSPMRLVDQLDPAVRERVRDALRASALAARPDFEEARQKRREAVEMGRSATFDAARAAALLEESRKAEIRGRARLEADAVALLATLEPDDRRALSEILTRKGRAASRDRDGRYPRAEPPKATPST